MTYRPIPSRPGYYAGDDGSIWSLIKGRARKRKWSLSGRNRSRAYIFFSDGKFITVHRLVLEAFAGPCPPGLECCHNDGNPLNNRADNLRWDTHAANVEDSKKHGVYLNASINRDYTKPQSRRSVQGRSHPNSKLTDETVREIARLKAEGKPLVEISDTLGVPLKRVSAILRGAGWNHITGLPKVLVKTRRWKKRDSG